MEAISKNEKPIACTFSKGANLFSIFIRKKEVCQGNEYIKQQCKPNLLILDQITNACVHGYID